MVYQLRVEICHLQPFSRCDLDIDKLHWSEYCAGELGGLAVRLPQKANKKSRWESKSDSGKTPSLVLHLNTIVYEKAEVVSRSLSKILISCGLGDWQGTLSGLKSKILNATEPIISLQWSTITATVRRWTWLETSSDQSEWLAAHRWPDSQGDQRVPGGGLTALNTAHLLYCQWTKPYWYFVMMRAQCPLCRTPLTSRLFLYWLFLKLFLPFAKMG